MGTECLLLSQTISSLQVLILNFKAAHFGRRGTASNDGCADLVADAVRHGARRITLCHLSSQNTPELAKKYMGVLEALIFEIKPSGRRCSATQLD